MKKTKSIIDNVLFNDEIPYITTPFFKFFEYDVLFKCGYFDKAFEGIKEYWGGIINMGASTVWEEFDPNMKGTEHYAMYGEPFDKSLCHAWGAGPIYFIGRYLVGLHPTDAGYKSFELEPKLNVGNYKVTLPVMNGCIKIEHTTIGCTIARNFHIWNIKPCAAYNSKYTTIFRTIASECWQRSSSISTFSCICF